jgi:hypothetical protein
VQNLFNVLLHFCALLLLLRGGPCPALPGQLQPDRTPSRLHRVQHPARCVSQSFRGLSPLHTPAPGSHMPPLAGFFFLQQDRREDQTHGPGSTVLAFSSSLRGCRDQQSAVTGCGVGGAPFIWDGLRDVVISLYGADWLSPFCPFSLTQGLSSASSHASQKHRVNAEVENCPVRAGQSGWVALQRHPCEILPCRSNQWSHAAPQLPYLSQATTGTDLGSRPKRNSATRKRNIKETKGGLDSPHFQEGVMPVKSNAPHRYGLQDRAKEP